MRIEDWRYRLNQLLVRVADGMGLRITRARPVDFTGGGMHPVAAYYAANSRSVVFDATLKHLRGLGANGFACHKDSNHPFVVALHDYQSGRRTEYAGSVLEHFHSSFQPQNAAEYLGARPSEVDSDLKKLPPEMAVLPWQNETPEEWRQTLWRSLVKDQKPFSLGTPLNIFDWNYFGPMSHDAGLREWRRLLALYSTMKREGYRRSSKHQGDIAGQLLLDDRNGDGWRFWIHGGGQHRAGVAGALGYSTVPVRLVAGRTPLVVRSHVSHWPQVRAGLFSQQTALRVFDQVFAGKQPFPWSLERRLVETGSSDKKE